MKIKWAVVPVAGMGTRMYPMTRSIPKELLPIVDRPIIDWILDEILDAGITDVVLVNHTDKVAINHYFENRKQNYNINIHFVYQHQPLGLGHAIHCANSIIGEQPFIVLLPDVLLVDDSFQKVSNATKMMIEQFYTDSCSHLLVENVSSKRVDQYGIADLYNGSDIIERLVEKPAIGTIESTLAIVGRYVFSAEFWRYLNQLEYGIGGEMQLTDAICSLLQHEKVRATILSGKSFDCGNKLGYMTANLTLSKASHSYQSFLSKI